MVQSKLQPKVNLKKIEIFSCPKCRFLSPDKQSLKRHIETSHSNETSRLSETSHSNETSHSSETSRLSETSCSNRKFQRNVETKRHDETPHSDESKFEIKSESDDNEGKNCCKIKKIQIEKEIGKFTDRYSV
jgi:Zn-finger nucleic acid-binding protein